MVTRIALLLFWLFHFLPKAVLYCIGLLIGLLLMVFARDRMSVVEKNISLCFPNLPAKEQGILKRKHFYSLGIALAFTSIAWWGSEKQVREIAEIRGWKNFAKADEKNPVIVLAPHFVGVEILGIRISMEKDAVVIYSHQKDKTFDRFLKKKRGRFSHPKLFSRQENLKSVIRALKARVPLYLLPDQDFGPKDSIFSTFFGVTCATTTGPSRIARLAGAAIVPVTITSKKEGYGYQITFFPEWQNFPSENINNDVRKMNEFIENQVREKPEEYYWVHKRFKTRRPGEPDIYKS